MLFIVNWRVGEFAVLLITRLLLELFLHDIALDVFLLTSQRNIQLDVNWLPREHNSEADIV